jgi:hypothetical protein
MSEKHPRNLKWRFTNSTRRLMPIPVLIGDQRRQASRPSPSLWLLCTRWLQYHAIQLRWDIERFLARRLKRRWGSR